MEDAKEMESSKQAAIPVLGISIFVLCLVGMFSTLWLIHGNTYGPDRITVSNQTSKPLSNVLLIGNGFKEEIPRIPPGQSVTVEVDPAGDSGLTVQFSSPKGVVNKSDMGYLCGCKFHVQITILPNYEVKSDLISLRRETPARNELVRAEQ
ncbi:MAG: hypothetical protein KY468_01250 [Armatimonadetes bacterium]|nr:hypothetical protein [Armatimonadota bacterium]